MKSLIIIVTLFCMTSCLLAERNSCCPNNETFVNKACPNNGTSWTKRNCKSGGAFLVSPEDVEFVDSDSMNLYGKFIPSDEYCVGAIDTPNNSMILVCFPSELPGTAVIFARFICCVISIVCLILTLIVYILLPNLRDLQGKCMMATVLSLIIAFVSLAFGQSQRTAYSYVACMTLASMIYFWFMCVFFWLNVVAFNVWRSVARSRLLSHNRDLFTYYCLYGTFCPLLLLTITLICHHTPEVHTKPDWAVETCWFSGSSAHWLYFCGPISVILLINIGLFIATVWKLTKEATQVSDRKYRSKKFKCWLYLKLFFIMGVCWIFEPLSTLFEGSGFWLITDYVNALQGLLIFLLLVVFRKRVRRDLAKKLPCCNRLPREWTTIPDEECEELEEESDASFSLADNNRQAHES